MRYRSSCYRVSTQTKVFASNIENSFFAHHLYAYFFLTSFYQAQARCHRIGQSKAVKVYRLITRNSYEREMLDKASLKLGLDRAVLQSMSGNKDSNVNGVRNQSL